MQLKNDTFLRHKKVSTKSKRRRTFTSKYVARKKRIALLSNPPTLFDIREMLFSALQKTQVTFNTKDLLYKQHCDNFEILYGQENRSTETIVNHAALSNKIDHHFDVMRRKTRNFDFQKSNEAKFTTLLNLTWFYYQLLIQNKKEFNFCGYKTLQLQQCTESKL